METLTINPATSPRDAYIITGLSGAGKTSVMRALEDVGFYCVDNLPVPLLATFVKLAFHGNTSLHKVAIGIDVRNEHFLKDFLDALDQVKLQMPGYKFTIVFVDARNETIYKRFQETRRKHPLGGAVSLAQAVTRERQLLEPLFALADIVLDTDVFNIHELRRWVNSTISLDAPRNLIAHVVSFGFKHEVPPESNLVYDVRFLPNPYFIPELKPLNGCDERIQEYIFSHAIANDYWDRLVDFLSFNLKRFYEEGRFAVSIAIGCTGGKHRSVAFVEKLTTLAMPQVQWVKSHRDLGKE